MDTRDRIYETITLRTTRGRVWLAISDAKEFGAWFGADFGGTFVPGATVHGTLKPTLADPNGAAEQERYAGSPIALEIECLDPDHRVAFRWHPYAADGEGSKTSHPKTRVEFQIENDPQGVVLTVTESGFLDLPLASRGKALEAHELGWEKRLELLRAYVEGSKRLGELAIPRSYQLAATPA